MTTSVNSNLKGECIAEFIGTGLLIFWGAGCVAALVVAGANFGQWEISIVWGLAVALAVYCTAGVSGAHINPAVTIALASFHGFEKSKVIPYITAQVAGAFTAAAIVYGLYANVFEAYELANGIDRATEGGLATAGIFSTYPNPNLTIAGAFAVEVTITCVLMFAILALGDENNGDRRGAMNPLLIGLVVATIGGSLGPLTGFAMNPARDFGPKFFAYLAGWDHALSGPSHLSMPYFLVPIFGPICGALLGGWAYPKLVGQFQPTVVGCNIATDCDNEADVATNPIK